MGDQIVMTVICYLLLLLIATDCYDFGTVRNLADLVNRAKLCMDLFKGFGLRNGQSWGHQQKSRSGPFRGVLHYRAHK